MSWLTWAVLITVYLIIGIMVGSYTFNYLCEEDPVAAIFKKRLIAWASLITGLIWPVTILCKLVSKFFNWVFEV